MPNPDRWTYAKAAPTPGKVCKDCVAEGIAPGRLRPAPHPGPRCATHWMAERRRRRLAAKGRRVEATYGLTPEEYDELYAFQGGRCALCRRARGISKRLAVDHDHRCCPGPTSCGECVRGLVCSTCNDVLAHFRDEVAAGHRLVAYLERWPTRRLADGSPSWVPGIPEPGDV